MTRQGGTGQQLVHTGMPSHSEEPQSILWNALNQTQSRNEGDILREKYTYGYVPGGLCPHVPKDNLGASSELLPGTSCVYPFDSTTL